MSQPRCCFSGERRREDKSKSKRKRKSESESESESEREGERVSGRALAQEVMG